jgi:F-type H+-transporting ATPase subunit epsilon
MLHFELVTPEKLVRSEDVYMVVVPGTEGDFGVLEHHAPFMSTVRDGALAIYRSDKGEPETIAIQGGFAEVSAAGLTVLAERTGEVAEHAIAPGAPAVAAAANKARLPDR